MGAYPQHPLQSLQISFDHLELNRDRSVLSMTLLKQTIIKRVHGRRFFEHLDTNLGGFPIFGAKDFPNIWVPKYILELGDPKISETEDKSLYLWSYAVWRCAEFARSLLFLRGMWQVLLCSTGVSMKKTKIAIVGLFSNFLRGGVAWRFCHGNLRGQPPITTSKPRKKAWDKGFSIPLIRPY